MKKFSVVVFMCMTLFLTTIPINASSEVEVTESFLYTLNKSND